MIPKILHQCSKSYEWEERKFADSAKKLLPDYEYKGWDDDSNRDFIKNTIPQYFDAYNRLPHNVARVDVARCLYLYVYGGIYFDTDYVFYKRPSEQFLQKKCVLAIEEENCKSIGGGDKVGNAFLASEPGLKCGSNLLSTFSPNLMKEKKNRIFEWPTFAIHVFERASSLQPRHNGSTC